MARFLLVTFLVALMTFTSKPSFAEKSRAKSTKSSNVSSSKTKKSEKIKKSKKTAKKSKKSKKSKKPQKKKHIKKADEAIVLRKSNGNRKTVYDNENLGEIYKKERAFFKSDYNSKKDDKPSKVSGPLAAIPTAVIESMVNNLIKAQQDRMPKEPVKPPEPAVAKTPDQLFNVEPTIQGNKRKVESKPQNPPPSAVVLASLSSKPKDKKAKYKISEKPKNVKSEIASELSIVSSSEKDNARVPSGENIDQDKLLEKVEKKYTSYFVKMNVKSEVTQALLERTKSYSGKIYLAPGGKFKMEVALPNKHIVLMTGKNIWVVDYPLDETQDKVQILHSKSAKNLKNQPFLNLFQGVGNLKKNFKIESSNGKNDEVTYKLTPKKKGEQIERIELKVDYQSELITSLSFWDSLGNQTQLQLSEQDFESKTPSKIFQFKPPKNSSITYL